MITRLDIDMLKSKNITTNIYGPRDSPQIQIHMGDLTLNISYFEMLRLHSTLDETIHQVKRMHAV